MIPYLKEINKINKSTKEEMIKSYCKIFFTEGVGDRILITIFQNFNVVDVCFLRVLNRATNFLITRNNTQFTYLSNAEEFNE